MLATFSKMPIHGCGRPCIDKLRLTWLVIESVMFVLFSPTNIASCGSAAASAAVKRQLKNIGKDAILNNGRMLYHQWCRDVVWDEMTSRPWAPGPFEGLKAGTSSAGFSARLDMLRLFLAV